MCPKGKPRRRKSQPRPAKGGQTHAAGLQQVADAGVGGGAESGKATGGSGAPRREKPDESAGQRTPSLRRNDTGVGRELAGGNVAGPGGIYQRQEEQRAPHRPPAEDL